MKATNDITQELMSMGSPLADLPRVMPYSVPPDYFACFEEQLSGLMVSLDVPETVSEWGKSMPFHVPANYFADLSTDIAEQISREESAPLPKVMPFTMPERYFDTLPDQILIAARASGSVKKTAKIIPLRRSNPWLKKWAAAAVILLTIGLGTFELFYSHGSGNTEKILASVPTNDIQDYLQRTYRLDVDRIVSNNELINLPLENKEIIQYLNESGWE